MTSTSPVSLRETAFRVCTALDRAGLTAVLAGGGASAVHAPEAVQSLDLDFIIVSRRASGEEAEAALAGVGFRPFGDHYENPESPFFLEFPPGPLAVGGELLDHWETLREGEFLLHVLDPTDACRDRLAAFLHWNDRGSLDQAVAVARARPGRIDVERIRKWCLREGGKARFDEFLARWTGSAAP